MGHRHPDHHPLDRADRAVALHDGDALAPAAATGRPPGAAPGDAPGPRHPGQHGPGGDHDRPGQRDHQHQLGRDADPRRGRGVCRPAAGAARSGRLAAGGAGRTGRRAPGAGLGPGLHPGTRRPRAADPGRRACAEGPQGSGAGLRHAPARRERPRPHGRAGPADGTVPQPGHAGLRAAPRDQEPADGADRSTSSSWRSGCAIRPPGSRSTS